MKQEEVKAIFYIFFLLSPNLYFYEIFNNMTKYNKYKNKYNDYIHHHNYLHSAHLKNNITIRRSVLLFILHRSIVVEEWLYNIHLH